MIKKFHKLQAKNRKTSQTSREIVGTDSLLDIIVCVKDGGDSYWDDSGSDIDINNFQNDYSDSNSDHSDS